LNEKEGLSKDDIDTMRKALARAYCANARDAENSMNYKEARAAFEKAIEIDPDYVLTLNWAAWALATSSESDYRDGSRSIELARRVCQITQDKDPSCLTTLAAAYAANSDFVSAIQCQTKAIDLLTPGKHLDDKGQDIDNTKMDQDIDNRQCRQIITSVCS